MQDFLQDSTRKMCTAFMIDIKEDKVSQEHHIEYLNKLVNGSKCKEEDWKDDQSNVTYETNASISSMLILKEKQGNIVLKTFKTSNFICALQRDREALLTAYPIQETHEEILCRSMKKLHL